MGVTGMEMDDEQMSGEDEGFQITPQSSQYLSPTRVTRKTLITQYDSAKKSSRITSRITGIFRSNIITLGTIIGEIRQTLKDFDHPDYPGYLSDEEYLELIPILITRLNDLNIRKEQHIKKEQCAEKERHRYKRKEFPMSNADTLVLRIAQEIGFDVIHTLGKYQQYQRLQSDHIQLALCTAERTRTEHAKQHGYLSNQITKTWELLQQQILEIKTNINAIEMTFKENRKVYNRTPVKRLATLKEEAEREECLSENAKYKTGKMVELPDNPDTYKTYMVDEELPDWSKRERAKIAHKKLLIFDSFDPIQIKEQQKIVRPIIKEYNKIFRLLNGQLHQTQNRLKALQSILEDLKQENYHLSTKLPTPKEAHQVEIDYSTQMQQALEKYTKLLSRLKNPDDRLLFPDREKSLRLACQNGGLEAVKTLVTLPGINVNKRTSGAVKLAGYTPLEIACSAHPTSDKHTAIVKVLLEAGAKLTGRNPTTGKSAFDIASEKGHEAICRVIREHVGERNIGFRSIISEARGDMPLPPPYKSQLPSAPPAEQEKPVRCNTDYSMHPKERKPEAQDPPFSFEEIPYSELSPDMQRYLKAEQRFQKSFQDASYEELGIVDEQDLVEPLSTGIPEIPVKLSKQLYCLIELMRLPIIDEKGKKRIDPTTQDEFVLIQVRPARTVYTRLENNIAKAEQQCKKITNDLKKLFKVEQLTLTCAGILGYKLKTKVILEDGRHFLIDYKIPKIHELLSGDGREKYLDYAYKEYEKCILKLSNSHAKQANAVNALANFGVFRGYDGDSQNGEEKEKEEEKEEKNPDQHPALS